MLILLPACSEQQETKIANKISNDESADLEHIRSVFEQLSTPSYHEPGSISGKALFGRETEAITICEADRASCRPALNADGTEQMCWLEMTPAAREKAARNVNAKGIPDGEYWVEGTGRITNRLGLFGHLNAYPCQVELSHIEKFEEGPPWFWTPPVQ
jgi:hypothetical protein